MTYWLDLQLRFWRNTISVIWPVARIFLANSESAFSWACLNSAPHSPENSASDFLSGRPGSLVAGPIDFGGRAVGKRRRPALFPMALRSCPHDGILLHPVLMGNSIDSRSRVSPSGSAGETATLTRRVLPNKTGPAGNFGMANVVPRRPTCSLHAIPGSSFCPRVPARAVECIIPCTDPRFFITRHHCGRVPGPRRLPHG